MSKSPAYHNSYKRCRNQVTKLTNNAKTQYFKTNMENSKNSKESWDLINKLLNRTTKTNSINNLKTGDQNITDDVDIDDVDMLKEY